MRVVQLTKWTWGLALFAALAWVYFFHVGSRPPLEADEFLDVLAERSFRYFIDYQSEHSGLVRDGSQWQPASMAATGFGLSALVIGAERGWIAPEEAKARAQVAIETCLRLSRSGDVSYSKWGFFYRFVDQGSGKRFVARGFRSELSIIDTALLVTGALTAGQYFGGEIWEAAYELYARVQWDQFLDIEKNLFFGAWTPESGFTDWHWEHYTDEVLLISLLAIGSPTHPVPPEVFYSWKREKVSVGGRVFIRSWHGGLYTYQYAHLWFDFRGLLDREGMDWWLNSVNAILANRDLCIKYSTEYKTYGPDSWGVTPCFHPLGTRGYEGRLSLMSEGSERPFHDGTVSPAGPAASLPFTPEYSLRALLHFYRTVPRIWGPYGFKSSFNLDQGWVAPMYYAIEVGATLLGIDAYRDRTVQMTFMSIPFIQEALKKAGFTGR